MKILISPHSDDESLFGAFTILREKPLVIIVTDSARQAVKGITAAQRREETIAAMKILGAEVQFLGIPDDQLAASLWWTLLPQAEHIYMPAYEEDGNRDHNWIAKSRPDGGNVTRYLTYTTHGKSTGGNRVPFEPEWVGLKLQALACYKSQIAEPSTCEHFVRSQLEYYAA